MTTNNTIEQVASFADLRTRAPATEGERVLLCGWNAGTYTGGGFFIGHKVTKDLKQKADDGGIVAAGKNFYWERVVDNPADLTVVHFGAVVDGKTDIAPAAYAMHKWTLANFRGLGIQLPSGRMFLSKLSLLTESNFFRMSGANVNFGYFANTVIVSDDKEEYLIDVKHRWVELANLNFEFTSTTGKPNKKGVFNNNVIGGQYFNGRCLRFTKVGGTCINLMDTLDSKIDQWYASQCTGDVLVNTWSDREKGAWNHTTALELTNFNIQSCNGGQVFTLPRCTQSLMRNGWIEHSDKPGDISGGHWNIENLSMEDCNNKLKAACCQIVEINRNLHGSLSGIDYTDDLSCRWLSEWERGRLDINPHGIFINGSLEPGTIMSRYKLSNSSQAPNWFRLGNFFIPQEGDSLEINLVGTGNYLSKGARLDDIDGVRQGGGSTLIRIQAHNGGNIGGTFQPSGSSPAQAVKFTKTGGGRITVYVQLKGYTRNVIPVITSSSKTHYEAGVSYYFEPDIKLMDPGVKEDEIEMSKCTSDILEQWSIGQAAGVGASNTGDLILKGKIENNHLAVQINFGTFSNPKVETRYLELKKEAK